MAASEQVVSPLRALSSRSPRYKAALETVNRRGRRATSSRIPTH